MAKRKQVLAGSSSTNSVDNLEPKWDLKSIRKDIEYLGSTHMSWKEKKELENRKVVSLGGKPLKGQRLPLSVAKVMMKKQKEREAKNQEENMILARFGGSHTSRDGKRTDRRKPEERVLRSTEGYFRNGVLDVKNLLKSSNSRPKDDGMSKIKRLTGEPKKNTGGKKKKKNGKKGRKSRR